MSVMKSLRRSFNNKEPPAISTPISTFPLASKTPSAQTPPKKVIRALESYRSEAPHLLSFNKGDFFFVTSEFQRADGNYEVTAPTTNSRGLVPARYFEELSRSQLPGGKAHTAQRHQTYYAVVLYDFQAERADELDAKAGEPISIVAQSNHEWFVAKPIGRLGGPGLIPVAFVELRDPASGTPLSNVQELMEKGSIHKVEEWKQATAEYKASSIPLGVIEDPAANAPANSYGQKSPPWNGQSQQLPGTAQRYSSQNPSDVRQSTLEQPNTPYGGNQSSSEPQPTNQSPEESMLPPGIIISATLPSFHFESNEYWFRINAIYQPDPSDERPPNTGFQLVLYRNYDDFYDFQIALLDNFPVEAGRVGPDGEPIDAQAGEDAPSSRILPYMPGPVAFVDDIITSVRRTELDVYLDELCSLGVQHGASHVLRHELVRQFFSPKPGDLMEDIPLEIPETEQDDGYPSQEPLQQDPYGNQQQFQSTSPTPTPFHQSHTNQHQPNKPSIDDVSRAVSDMRLDPNDRLDPRTHSRNNASIASHSSQGSVYDSGYGRASNEYGDQSRRGPSPSPNSSSRSKSLTQDVGSRPDSLASNVQSKVSGGRSPSVAGEGNYSDPPFLKIKVFHAASEDLIAIRVPPRVTYNQLVNKLKDRLSVSDVNLSWREDPNQGGAGYPIYNDNDLRQWLSRGDKLVLFC